MLGAHRARREPGARRPKSHSNEHRVTDHANSHGSAGRRPGGMRHLESGGIACEQHDQTHRCSRTKLRSSHDSPDPGKFALVAVDARPNDASLRGRGHRRGRDGHGENEFGPEGSGRRSRCRNQEDEMHAASGGFAVRSLGILVRIPAPVSVASETTDAPQAGLSSVVRSHRTRWSSLGVERGNVGLMTSRLLPHHPGASHDNVG